MIITSVMMIMIEVAGNIAGQYFINGLETKDKERTQRTVPDLDYVHTFPFGLLIPSLIYRMTPENCDKASCQSVGDNDSANYPCGYWKASIRKYAKI